MMRTLTRWLSIAVIALCCLLVASSVEAQDMAQSVVWNSVELGLTSDQKAKIEAVLKDVENRHRAEIDNKNLDHDECIAKLRELQKSERASVNGILTPAQQRKLKDIRYPKQQWAVSVSITAGADLSHYTARLEGYPSEYLSYTIHKQAIRLSVLDAYGKSVPNGPWLTLSSNVPDVIKPVIDEDGNSSCQVEFTLDRKTAKPGLYTIQFRATVDATDAETHERVKIDDAIGTLSVYLTPQPDKEPALQPGQRFIGTPWEEASASAVTPYHGVKSGKPITWREIATKVATLQRIEPCQKGSRLTFALEGHTGSVFIETERQVTDLPYLTPILTEPTVRALKAKYEGKQVWCYGGPGAQCVSTMPGMAIGMSGRVDTPLCIRHVDRIYLPKEEMAVGNATFVGGERQSAFITDNPLVVILDAPAKGLEFSALTYAGDKGSIESSIESVVSDPRAHCLGLWNEVSDSWDFERAYSLSNPFEAQSAWPANMRKAVLNGEVVNGMTREMVARAMGWPSIYATKDEMLTLDDWTYDNIPFQGHVYFKKGLVSSQEWPTLP